MISRARKSLSIHSRTRMRLEWYECLNRLELILMPNRWQDVQSTFQKVTDRPFGYMVLDFHPKSPDDHRVLSHLLKEEGCVRCYQSKQDAAK